MGQQLQAGLVGNSLNRRRGEGQLEGIGLQALDAVSGTARPNQDLKEEAASMGAEAGKG